MSGQSEIIFGINPVQEKLRVAPNDVLEILFAEAANRAALRAIEREAVRHRLRISRVAVQLLDQLAAGQRHQGVIAKIESFHYLSLDKLLERISTAVSSGCILILDGVTDPRNFGALLRTAEAVGIEHIIIPKHRSVEVNPLVVKASSGAVFYLNIVKVTNMRTTLSELKKRGYWIVGLHATATQTIYETSYPERLAIVLGNEGKGIRQINLRECDFVVSIPMLGKVASLNVAVAGAIFLYEVLRQRQTSVVKR
ncbi:MAG TPA: 23S rRNA (guanosine(2251)-2'-O)-methyltransferase RlmB [Candidatus Binatia bacterium]